jgi:predicted secreted protein
MRTALLHSIGSLIILLALLGCDKPTPPPADDESTPASQPAASQPAEPASAPAASTAPPERTPAELIDEGWQLSNQGEHAQAEAVFRKAIEAGPEESSAEAYNGLGWALLNQNQSEPAAEAFQQCVEIEPTHPGALNGLGWIAYDAGQHDQAIAYWQRAIAPDPARATASLAGLGMAYMHKKEYEQAATIYQTWLKAEPDNADAKEGLDRAKQALGEPAESQPASAPAAVVVTEVQTGQDVQAVVGQEIRIELKGNATTGFAWALASLSGDAIEPTEYTTLPDETRQAKGTYTPDPAEDGQVGTAGVYAIVFHAVEPGRSSVKMVYHRPWEKDQSPAQTFELTVVVTQPQPE